MDRIKQFRNDITRFITKTGVTKTALGIAAANDPHIIFRCLKPNSDPRLSTVQKLYDFMENYKV